MDRRQFLKGVFAGSAATAACSVAPVQEAEAFIARDPLPLPPKAVGMLYDSTLCVGCKACVAACKRANGMPVDIPYDLASWNGEIWDTAEDLGGKTLNVIKVYQAGDMDVKDNEDNGFAFVKRHCLHCVDPSCVSVCPVKAMQKDETTGIVTHDKDRCIGCRYCVLGCPFGVPRYQYDDAFGQITKCKFCDHLQAEGKLPACCDVCPTGASLFGEVRDLQAEADKRLSMQPGDVYDFPRGNLSAKPEDVRPTHEAQIPTYQKHVYGQTEVGSTQVRYLSSVSFEKLGLPALPEQAYSAVSEGLQHTLYKGMIAPAVLLGGLMYFAYKNTRDGDDDGLD